MNSLILSGIVVILMGLFLGGGLITYGIHRNIVCNLEQERDNYCRRMHNLLVEYEGWRRVPGLPRPMPPLPDR